MDAKEKARARLNGDSHKELIDYLVNNLSYGNPEAVKRRSYEIVGELLKEVDFQCISEKNLVPSVIYIAMIQVQSPYERMPTQRNLAHLSESTEVTLRNNKKKIEQYLEIEEQ